MLPSRGIETIRSIQKEYVRHVRSFYRHVIDEFLGTRKTWAEHGPTLMRKILRSHGLQLPYRGQYLPADIHRMLSFLSANRDFWLSRSAPLAEALKASGLFALGGSRHLADPNLAAKQLLYFDTVLLPDSTFHADEFEFFETAFFGALTNITSQILIVGTFQKAIEADSDCPLVIFYPEHFPGSDPTRSAQEPSDTRRIYSTLPTLQCSIAMRFLG